MVLVVCLFSSPTPAAPRTIVDVASAASVTLKFWYPSSWLAKLIQGQRNGPAKKQETQAERDAKVSRIQILPENVVVDLSDEVKFVAVAYDDAGNTVGGVKMKWSGRGSSANQKVRISPQGNFEATTPGEFTIVAKGGGQTSEVKVTVRATKRRDLKEKPARTIQVSSRDLPPEAVASLRESKRSRRGSSAKRAHTARKAATTPAPMFQSGGGWDGSNWWSADDPGNRVGDPPDSPPDGGIGSGNFQFSAPIYSAEGRGIDVQLGLAYNSRLWNKAGTQMSYDNDKTWPAPGFNLGFGKLLGMTIPTGCMLVDADGTRHSYTGNISFYSWGTVGVMHTTDGSLIDYTYQTGTNGVMVWAQAKYPNGTIVNFGAYSQAGGGLFPTWIEDANGNIVSIAYVNNAGPRISAVVDTMGRVVNFHYNAANLLTAITGPGLNGGTRTLVRLHYHQHTINPGFNGMSIAVRDYYPWVLDAIYYPGNNTGYWLNDSDSYSSYGMLAKVVEQRGMGFSASSLNDMGTVSQGSMTRKEEYNYPLTPNYSLQDAPTYTSMVETWSRDGTNVDTATTGYVVDENPTPPTPRTTVVTLPNGTKRKQFSVNAPGSWDDGLFYEDHTYVTEGVILEKNKIFWEPGAYNSRRQTRIEKTDERGQMTATEYSYGSSYNQVTEVRDYDYGGTSLLRATRTTYQNSSNYTNRHIFNLPLTVDIFAADNVTRVSRTEYQYDGQTLTDTPGVTMHDETHNPYGPLYEQCDCYQWDYWMIECLQWNCWYYSNYNPATDYRGNVTQVTNYADAASLTSPVTETRRYDITGNMVTSSTACCQQTTFGYSVNTQYAYPHSQTRGSATDPYAQITTSATCDFNTGLGLTLTDANGRISSSTYDPNTLRPTSAISPTGAHTDHSYDVPGMSITTTTYLSTGGVADQVVKLFNGRGQIRQEKALAPNSAWDIVDTAYNNMGQVAQQTRPYRTGETPQWSTSTYDALGRTTILTSPEGSQTKTFYNEVPRPDVASSSPGQTTRVQDAWGRERWGRADASGRLVELVEPIFWGLGSVFNGGMQTTYAYNTLGSLTQVVQGAQTRTFKYDSLGRLTAQKLAEMNATLNDAGAYVGSGTWSDVFTYDERSNLLTRTDARGVKTVYNYNNDPLNRLQSVSWDTSGFGDTANPIVAAPTVSFTYRTKGSPTDPIDITQIVTTTTAGVSTETLAYNDTEGRVSAKTLTLNSRSDFPFVTDYSYDSLHRLTDMLYPAEYGNGSALRKAVHLDYDIASRINGLSFGGQTHASNIAYNAASQMTSIAVGTGTNQVAESYSYSAQTGLIENQTATRNGTTLLNLSYDYVGANGKRSGQLTKILNNLDHGKDRGFEYDALARLLRATGGQNHNWAQSYEYDRYGNRFGAHSYVLEDYIKNFYQSALNRQPNSTELNNWLNTLRTNYSQGQSQFRDGMISLGVSLFTSQEYINRNRTDTEFVYDLYKAYLYREPDSGGWAFWVSQVPINGRNNVRLAFDLAPEFHNKVRGISPYGPPAGVTVPRDGLQGQTFDPATNRVTNSGWAYDAAGNQTRTQNSSGVWSRYQYDAAGRLAKVKADDNVTVLGNYTYSDDGQRLVSEEAGVRTYYVAQGLSLIGEYTETGGSTSPLWSKFYVYLSSRLLATLTPNAGSESVMYHHPDRLGTRLVTNPANGASFEQVTMPFGTAFNSESTGSTNQRFTSYERSATTGLDYAVNRHYDSQQGRFSQVDPTGMKATTLTSPQSFNLYTYVQNDPVNFVDPAGLEQCFARFMVTTVYNTEGEIISVSWEFLFAYCIGGGGGGFIPDGGGGGGQGGGTGEGAPHTNNQPQQHRDQKACDEKLAKLFGGQGALVGSVRDPVTVGSNPNTLAFRQKYGGPIDRVGERPPGHGPAPYPQGVGKDKGGIFHIFPNSDASSTTGALYAPPGGDPSEISSFPNSDPSKSWNVLTVSYSSGPYAGVSLEFVHVRPGSGRPNAEGSVQIGLIGGLGSIDSKNYIHTHVVTKVNGQRADPRKIFCKEFGF
jgi:RHS repeat-associated protein